MENKTYQTQERSNKLTNMFHKYMCEACEQAPAAFICKADAASLCVEAIHSANPLSRLHHRVPVMPVSGSIYGVESRGGILSEESLATIDNEDEDETASWLLFDAPAENIQNQNGETNGFLFSGDEYVDLVEYNSCQHTQFSDDHECNDLQFDDKYMNDVINKSNNYINIQQQRYAGGDADSVVPVGFGEAKKHHQFNQHNFKNLKFELRMEYETSNSGYGYSASLGHNVSMSSLDVGVVPDSSISKARSPKGTIDLFSSYSIEMPTQLTPVDRKARVQRYMEKKKTRKFEKTIRYASRKAYAETRPRIKGRFAKKTNVDYEVNQIFSTTLMTEGGYCVVPSLDK